MSEDNITYGSVTNVQQERTEYRILILDDQQMIRRMYSKLIETFGFNVDSASTGPEALSLYAGNSFDLVISDYHMSPMNGIEFCMELRNVDPKARIIMNSAGASESDVRRMINAGAIDYFPKPTGIRQLERIIRRSLQ
jgi:two-component system response regulator AtoC